MLKWFVAAIIIIIALDGLYHLFNQPNNDPLCSGLTNRECESKKNMDDMSSQELQKLNRELLNQRHDNSIRR